MSNLPTIPDPFNWGTDDATVRKFIDIYLTTLNIGRAERLVGWTDGQGREALCREDIQAIILRRRAYLLASQHLGAEDVIREYIGLGFSNMQDFASWKDGEVTFLDSDALSRAELAAVKKIKRTTRKVTGKDGSELETSTMELELHSKTEALGKLGQSLGLFDAADPQGQGEQEPTNVRNWPPELLEKIKELIMSQTTEVIDVQGTEEPS